MAAKIPEGAVCSGDAESLAAGTRMLVLDVDGVMTDGRLLYGPEGQLIKSFNTQDGLGISTAHKAGLRLAMITGRDDAAVRVRAEHLRIDEYHPGHDSKLPTLKEISARLQIPLIAMAYLGDDWIDLDPMNAVGLPMAVANARPEVKAAAKYVCAASGGHGAVREAIEFILSSRPGAAPLWNYWVLPESGN